MKKILIIALLISTMGLSNAFAEDNFDFSSECSTGQTLYYKIIDEANHYVALVAPSRPYSYSDPIWGDYPQPTGEIDMPSLVFYNGLEYSVKEIQGSAFKNCNDLVGLIRIPNTVNFIDYSSFYGCNGITSLIIPNSVTDLGNSAFHKCGGLESIVVASDNAVYDSRNDCNAIIETATNKLISGCKNTIIPNTVTSIGAESFIGCKDLVSIDIPNSVTDIGTYAFGYCSSLISISISNKLTYINSGTFNDCSSLESISIPESVTHIWASAFSNCSSLTSIAIPESVTIIGQSAFSNCSNLTSITIPNTITSIANNLFKGCSSLESISIPESVSSIGDYAFYSCSSLTSVTIPSKVISIGACAFAGRSNLSQVISLSIEPPLLGLGAFGFVSRLVVPCGSEVQYKESDWNDYFGIIDGVGEYGDYYHIFKAVDGCESTSDSFIDLPNSAQSCELVRFTIKPNQGCLLDSIWIQNAENPNLHVAVEQEKNNVFSFTMPSFHISIRAIFVKDNALEETQDNFVTVYPNPTSGLVKIKAESINHISIYNKFGQMIHEENVKGNSIECDFSNCGAGVYLIRVITSFGVVTKHIIVTQ